MKRTADGRRIWKTWQAAQNYTLVYNSHATETNEPTRLQLVPCAGGWTYKSRIELEAKRIETQTQLP